MKTISLTILGSQIHHKTAVKKKKKIEVTCKVNSTSAPRQRALVRRRIVALLFQSRRRSHNTQTSNFFGQLKNVITISEGKAF